MSNTLLAQGVGNILGLIFFAAILIGSAILRARAEAKARERRRGAAEEGEGPEAVPPEVHAILRQIGREAGPQDIPVGRPLPPAPSLIAAPPKAQPLLVRPVAPERPARRPRPRPAGRPVPMRPVPADAVARVPGAAAPPVPAAELRRALEADLTGGPAGLRKAILLAEILGSPRALRPLEDRLGGPPPHA